MPKSMIFTTPVLVIITFAGLMSRCTIPASWLTCNASHTGMSVVAASSGLSGPPSATMSFRFRPLTSSITI